MPKSPSPPPLEPVATISSPYEPCSAGMLVLEECEPGDENAPSSNPGPSMEMPGKAPFPGAAPPPLPVPVPVPGPLPAPEPVAPPWPTALPVEPPDEPFPPAPGAVDVPGTPPVALRAFALAPELPAVALAELAEDFIPGANALSELPDGEPCAACNMASAGSGATTNRPRAWAFGTTSFWLSGEARGLMASTVCMFLAATGEISCAARAA